MAQLTVDQHGVGTDATVPSPPVSSPPVTSTPRPDPSAAGPGAEDLPLGHPRLRSVLPAAVAVGLLLGVVVVGGVLLRDLLEFGVWVLGEG
ncbi:hypothetical protein [Actinotalea solisilvae]|uniref:hypothetical protein n=1 Tax=Actinotalea solisilvae TaxID=2072922 RepID=UPI0018F2757F|nr:hypothetical protein [Actinotalea solisilvae]